MIMFLVAQRLNRLPARQETQVQSLGQEDHLEKEMATHSSPLAWKIPWMEEPGRLYSPWDSKESHMTEQLHFLQKVSCMHCGTHCPRPCTRPPPTHASTGDSWTLTGKSGSVSCGVTGPFSWILVCTRFCLCSPRVCFPGPV